jgi:hypothetical protein
LKFILTTLLALFSSQVLAVGILPDLTKTPGDVNHRVTTAHICTPGYTEGYWYEHKWYPKGQQPKGSKPVRSVSAKEKRVTFMYYGLGGNDRIACTDGYEIDHLISLELGGSNTFINRWPQTYCRAATDDGKEIIPSSARDKDRLENALKTKVCSGLMTLQEAQKEIATDWVSSYKKHILNQ